MFAHELAIVYECVCFGCFFAFVSFFAAGFFSSGFAVEAEPPVRSSWPPRQV